MSEVDDRGIDWGRTSRDYSRHRPNYPLRFFQLLAIFGVGLPGQRMLDLGTGVGFLPEQFARAGATVTGVDISEGQILEARARCEALGLALEFLQCAAEDTRLPSSLFDVITASQSWLYFDKPRVIDEVKRLLKPGGVLVTSHFCWLPRQDRIARASEQLVLRHNPRWTGADWDGVIPHDPQWAAGYFDLHAMFVFDASIAFTYESWRGRFRACRGVGAALGDEEVRAFDREHDSLLRGLTAEPFEILHRIDAHIFTMSPGS